MKSKFLPYDYETHWQSHETICFLTGSHKDSLIELYRKTRNGKEKTPVLFSRWVPNYIEIEKLGKGTVRNYYFTDLLFISLYEQFKINKISNEILSLFYIHFTALVEDSSNLNAVALAKNKHLINLPNFESIIQVTNKKIEKIVKWKFSIRTWLDGTRKGFIEAEREKSNSSIPDILFHTTFDITDPPNLIEKYKKESPRFWIDDSNPDGFACNIEFNLNPIHSFITKRIKELEKAK